MTFNANRYHIEPMLGGVTRMMVLFCTFITLVTLQGLYWRQYTQFNSVGHSTSSVAFFRIFCSSTFLCCPTFLCLRIFLRSSRQHFFPTSALGILFAVMSCFWCFCVLGFADFTLIMPAKLPRMVTRKLRQGLNLLAFRARLGFNGFRHGCFSSKQLCLEPMAVRPVIGLPIVADMWRAVKWF